jgi:hypothetical protein
MTAVVPGADRPPLGDFRRVISDLTALSPFGTSIMRSFRKEVILSLDSQAILSV